MSLQWDVVATAVGNKLSLQAIGGGVKSSCKSRVGVQQLSTVFSSACLYSGYLLSPYSCGIRILSAMKYGARSSFILSAHFLSTFTEVVLWSFRSSSLAVARQKILDRVAQASVIRILPS